MPGLQAFPFIVLAGLLGCTSSDRGSAGSPTPAPVGARTEAAQPSSDPRDDGMMLRLSDGVTGVRVPLDYVPLADHEAERLRLAAKRINPRAEVELVGRKSPRGFAHGMTAAMSTALDDLPALYGETVRSSVALLVQRAQQERPLSTGEGTLDASPDEAGRFIDLRMVMPVAGRGEMRSRSRHWATSDGVFHEAACQCAGPGCSFGDEGCVLPRPPSDALPLDEPITGGTPPVEQSIAQGRATVAIAPFFTPISGPQREAFEAAERERFPQLHEYEVKAWVGPRDDTGIVFLFASGWCTRKGASCEVAEIAASSRESAVAQTRSDGIEPVVSVHVQHTPEHAVHTYEVRAGLLSWERHVFWQDGAAVRGLACLCGGPACATVEASCRLDP